MWTQYPKDGLYSHNVDSISQKMVFIALMWTQYPKNGLYSHNVDSISQKWSL